MINNLILVGNIANNIELRSFNDTKVCNMVLAVQRPYRDMETNEYNVDFLNVSLWDATALMVNQYCKKGDTVGVKGRLVQKNYEEDGIKKSRIEIVGERVVFIHLKHSYDGLKEKQVEDQEDGANLEKE